MTDRGEGALRTSPDVLEVGPSSMRWDGTSLTITIDEVAVPHLDRVRGEIRVHPAAVSDVELSLHPNGSHLWRPYAPVAEIEVAFDRPGWTWCGSGYFDANFGTRALEADFRAWNWSRRPLRGGALCLYDAERRDGSELAAALWFDGKGQAQQIEAPPLVRLARSKWAVKRETRGDAGSEARAGQVDAGRAVLLPFGDQDHGGGGNGCRRSRGARSRPFRLAVAEADACGESAAASAVGLTERV